MKQRNKNKSSSRRSRRRRKSPQRSRRSRRRRRKSPRRSKRRRKSPRRSRRQQKSPRRSRKSLLIGGVEDPAAAAEAATSAHPQGLLSWQQQQQQQEQLLWAAESGHADMVRVLLEKGADVNHAADEDERTPLWAASQYGYNLEVVRLLLAGGANVDQADWKGWTPLFIASHNGNVEVVRILLTEGGANVNRAVEAPGCENDGETPLFTATQHRHLEVMRVLLESGANVDQAESWNGDTPLHVASSDGYFGMVHLLLQYDADIVRTNNRGETALFISIQAGHNVDISNILRLYRIRKIMEDQNRRRRRNVVHYLSSREVGDTVAKREFANEIASIIEAKKEIRRLMSDMDVTSYHEENIMDELNDIHSYLNDFPPVPGPGPFGNNINGF